MTEAVRWSLTEEPSGAFSVWEQPDPQQRYVIGADVAGHRIKDKSWETRHLSSWLQDRPDWCCMIVLSLHDARHVATWHGYQDPIDYALTIATVGYYYNTAFIVPEATGPGVAVCEELRTLSYPELYRRRSLNLIAAVDAQPHIGFHTDPYTRNEPISLLMHAINNGLFTTPEQELVNEMRTMQFDEGGTARARGKNKDDRVMALGLALVGRRAILQPEEPTVAEGRKLSRFDRMVWEQHDREQELRAQGDRVRRRVSRSPYDELRRRLDRRRK